jgi:shikimate dehydrogenase
MTNSERRPFQNARQAAIRHSPFAIGSPTRITGATRLVGVIGWPVSHSRSPRMHNAAFAALGLDWAYVPLPVPPDHVGAAVRGLAALGFAGANVTVPHKQAVMPFLDALTPTARAVGAVNTIIVRPDGSLLGENTDGAGFMADLRMHGMKVGEGQRMVSGQPDLPVSPCHRVTPPPCHPVPVSPRPRVTLPPCPRVLLLGAGGAARAVAYALAEAGARVAVANRSLERATELCQTIAAALPGETARLSAHPFPEALADLTAEAELIVNTTSLGLHAGDPLPWDASVPFRPGQVVYDLIYNRPTELLALARSQGAVALDGLGMLVHQGARAFELWTGMAAPVEVMFAAIRET